MSRRPFRASHVADAADELCIAQWGGAGNFAYFGSDEGCAVGSAYTLRQGPLYNGAARHGEVVHDLASEGDVIVIAGQVTGAATWGMALALRCRANGVAGVIIDGAVRDSHSLVEAGVPTLSRATSPLRSKGRLETVTVGQPVEIGGVTIGHGDIIFFDRDGFVCVPRDAASAVEERAIEIARREELRDASLLEKSGLA